MSATPFASPPSTPHHAPAGTLWSLMRGYRLLFAAAVVAMFLGNSISYFAPLIGSATLDVALAESATAELPALSVRIIAGLGGPERLRENLWIGGLAMAGLTAISGCFTFLKGWFAALASDGIARRLKTRLYDHLQRLPTRFHDTANSGDLVQRCTSDVETIRMCLAAQIVEIGNALILIATALPLMLWLDLTMTVLSLVLVPPIVLWGFVYFRRVKHAFKQVDEAEGRLTSRVQENLHGIRVVRAFARQEFEQERFATANADHRDRSLHLIRLMAWYWASSDFVCLAQNGLVLLGGAWLVSRGQLTVGGLFGFMAILNMMLWPVRMIGRVLTDLGKTTVALKRVQEILDVAEENSGEPTVPASSDEKASGRIEFRHVIFAHANAPDGRLVRPAADDRTPASGSSTPHALNGVSFTVASGETVAVLGPSGSGKSTLIHLLLRFYDPQSGEILLDGRELRTLERHGLRRQFGVVMQEPFLYARNLRDNIRFGRSSANEHEIADAARTAAIHETIASFGAGYDTEIGERGITLSGGQRQRVAIARAVLRNPPVLVLDDALSAVDSETESAVIDALRSRHRKRTTILIAHRLSTLAHADRIVVLEHGRVAQIGTHRELVHQPGLYQRLWRIQTEMIEVQPRNEARVRGIDSGVTRHESGLKPRFLPTPES